MSHTARAIRPYPRRRARLITAVAALVIGGLLTTASPPAQANNVRVTRSLFGMHENTSTGTSFAAVHEGWIRLWDSGVQWKDIEQKRGVYTWTRLDTLVNAARSHGAGITMVVAGTPSFYSSNPWNVPADQIGKYKAFVHALMVRYKGRIGSYQVWNEANIKTFWAGSQSRMAQLTKAMHDVGAAVDPKATIVAPPMVTRLGSELNWIKGYETQRLGGKPVWRYYDAVALSLYPLPKYSGRLGVPEDAMRLLAAAKSRLRAGGVPGTKPIWDTEINYGLQSGARGGTAATPISATRQAANVMRTYLLQAAGGVKRVAWYRYDWGRIAGGGTLGNTLITDPDNAATLTAAGHAYVRVQQWMHGTLLGKPGRRPCAKDSRGTYTCVVKDASGVRRIYWNPFRKVTVKLPAGVHHKQTVLGTSSTLSSRKLTVTYAPVMVSR
jgi:hypothetical protein